MRNAGRIKLGYFPLPVEEARGCGSYWWRQIPIPPLIRALGMVLHWLNSPGVGGYDLRRETSFGQGR